MKNVLWSVLAVCSTACAAGPNVDGSELEVAGQSQSLAGAVEIFRTCVDFPEDAWEVCYFSYRNVHVNGPQLRGAGIKYYATAEHWFNGEVTAKGHVRCHNPDTGDSYNEQFERKTLVLPIQADGTASEEILTCREGYSPDSMPTSFDFRTVIVES